jgi:hypothetical protein
MHEYNVSVLSNPVVCDHHMYWKHECAYKYCKQNARCIGPFKAEYFLAVRYVPSVICKQEN